MDDWRKVRDRICDGILEIFALLLLFGLAMAIFSLSTGIL